MAELIQDKVYQVAIGGRWNFTLIQAENEEDLIRFLAEQYPNKESIYGATEICKDGTTRTAKIISHPLFEDLYSQNTAKEQALPAGITMIRNRPWAVLLPTAHAEQGTPSLWDEFMGVIGEENCPNQTVSTMCQETFSSDRPSIRGGAANHQDTGCIISSSLRSRHLGFRPVLMPLDPETLEPRPSFLLGRNDGDLFRMGSLYMNGIPQHNPQEPAQADDPPQYSSGAKLYIGESSPNPEDWITWVKVGNVLMSDRVLMNDISFDDLARTDLLYGPEQLRKKAPFEQLLANAQRQVFTSDTFSERREACLEK